MKRLENAAKAVFVWIDCRWRRLGLIMDNWGFKLCSAGRQVIIFLLESMLWFSEMTPQSLDLTTAFLIFTLFPIFLFLYHHSYGPWMHYVFDCTSMCIHACVCVCIHSEAFTTQFAVDFYSFCSYFWFHVVDSTDFNCVDSAGFFWSYLQYK